MLFKGRIHYELIAATESVFSVLDLLYKPGYYCSHLSDHHQLIYYCHDY